LALLDLAGTGAVGTGVLGLGHRGGVLVDDLLVLGGLGRALGGGDASGAGCGFLAAAASGAATGDGFALGLLDGEHVGRHRGDDDGDVTGALADAGGTATSPGAEAVQRPALVG